MKKCWATPKLSNLNLQATKSDTPVLYGIQAGAEYKFMCNTCNQDTRNDKLIKKPPTMQETWLDSWVRKIPWRRDRLPTPVFLAFPGGSAGKEFACNSEGLGSITL